MSIGNIGPMQLLIVLLIVLLVFGTKKLRNIGGDLGSAIRDFRKGMSEEEDAGKADSKPSEAAAAESAHLSKSSDPTAPKG